MAETTIFDTHKYARKLTHGGGLNERQAAAHVEALQDAMREGVATKSDLLALRHEIRDEMQTFRGEMRDEIQTFRGEMRDEMQTFRKEMRDEMRHEMQTFRKEMRDDMRHAMQTFRKEMRDDMRKETQTFRDLLQAQRQFTLLGFSLIGTLILVATFLEKIL